MKHCSGHLGKGGQPLPRDVLRELCGAKRYGLESAGFMFGLDDLKGLSHPQLFRGSGTFPPRPGAGESRGRAHRELRPGAVKAGAGHTGSRGPGRWKQGQGTRGAAAPLLGPRCAQRLPARLCACAVRRLAPRGELGMLGAAGGGGGGAVPPPL